MLPYPSGNLHMGHVRNYSVGDAVAWYKRLKGFNVLHPIGWDSFGQPAEDAAIKRGVNPREWTEENIKAMRGQLERLGLSYDWRRQMAAHRPEYYKFDQWFFLKMYEMGLAYKKKTQVNWCETRSGDAFERTGERRLVLALRQSGHEKRSGAVVPENDRLRRSVARRHGRDRSRLAAERREAAARLDRAVRGRVCRFQGSKMHDSGKRIDRIATPESIRVFTTRIDTIYGANAIVVAAEHPVVEAHLRRVFGRSRRRRSTEIRPRN